MTPGLLVAFATVAVLAAFGIFAAVAPRRLNHTPARAESVDEYADRELAQFELPHLDQDEIDRLRAIAAADAKEVRRP